MSNLAFPSTIATASTTQYGYLGARVVLGGSEAAEPLFSVVTSTGALAGGPNYEPTSSDTQINKFANSGDMEWVYVFNDSGSTIERGAHVEADQSKGPFTVLVGGGAKPTIGVAQFDIPDGYYAWALVRGKGYVLLDGTGCSAEDALTPAASGAWDVSTTLEEQKAHAGAAIGASAVGAAYIDLSR